MVVIAPGRQLEGLLEDRSREATAVTANFDVSDSGNHSDASQCMSFPSRWAGAQ
jgi:hypothetical protein